jgi:hypothetical protein
LASSEVEATVKQKEFGVKDPEVAIIGQGTWYIDGSEYDCFGSIASF